MKRTILRAVEEFELGISDAALVMLGFEVKGALKCLFDLPMMFIDDGGVTGAETADELLLLKADFIG